MSERIMTDKQLLELHDDIRDGVSMIVAVDHYRQLEAKEAELDKPREENRKLCAEDMICSIEKVIEIWPKVGGYLGENWRKTIREKWIPDQALKKGE